MSVTALMAAGSETFWITCVTRVHATRTSSFNLSSSASTLAIVPGPFLAQSLTAIQRLVLSCGCAPLDIIPKSLERWMPQTPIGAGIWVSDFDQDLGQDPARLWFLDCDCQRRLSSNQRP
jgi:hypothetical protein